MAKDDQRVTVSLEELAYSGMLQAEPITRLLVKKGIIAISAVKLQAGEAF